MEQLKPVGKRPKRDPQYVPVTCHHCGKIVDWRKESQTAIIEQCKECSSLPQTLHLPRDHIKQAQEFQIVEEMKSCPHCGSPRGTCYCNMCPGCGYLLDESQDAATYCCGWGINPEGWCYRCGSRNAACVCEDRPANRRARRVNE